MSFAIRALGALAQETRLEIFRRLVVAGPEGLTAGAIAALIGCPAPTLSFHLKELEGAGLVARRREGRHMHFSIAYPAMRELLSFLTEDCCQGRPEICAPAPHAPKRPTKRRTAKARS